MPEIEYSVRIAAPVEQVWNYVEILPNWAPLMIGFQKLELVDDRRSIWTLRGDVGILSREVDIQADITRWEPLRRVEFTVSGLTERISGEGSFRLDALEDSSADAPPLAPEKVAWYRRLRLVLARFVMRRLAGSARVAAPAGTGHPTATAAASAAAGGTAATRPDAAGGRASRLTFHLKVSPDGPMAPMLELLMAPMLEPAAEDLARGIRQALEER